MYCVKCGVRLADTEKRCPLCNTVVYHPEVTQGDAPKLYPSKKMPKTTYGRGFVCGAIIILFLIPLILSLFSDIHLDGRIDWFGYVAGAIVLTYLIVALPVWFKRPNPVIFVPCDFAGCAVYLFYINYKNGGGWFWSFALPVVLGLCVIASTLVTLLRYLPKGRLYAIGGCTMGLGAWIFLIESLMANTFEWGFVGWSIYPLISLLLVGGLLIYLAMNRVAREKIERKVFF